MKMRVRFGTSWLVLLLFACGWLLGCESDLDKANALAKAKQYKEAGKLYEKILKTDKKNKGAFEGLGKMYCQKSRYSGVMCLDVARRFVAVHADHKQAKIWLKRALFSNAFDLTTSGELTKAEEYLNKYLKLDPNDGKAYFIGGFIKFRQGKKSPVDPDDLRVAIKRLGKAVKHSVASTTIKINAKDKKPSPLQWEAYVMQGNIYEALLIKAMTTFAKSKAGKAKGAKFVANAKDFAAGVAAYTKAHALNKTQSKKAKHFYPYYQVAMFHANFKRDYKGAIKWLVKGEKEFKNSREIIQKIYQIYKIMASESKGRKNRRKRKAYNKKAKEYAAKFANLPKKKK